MVGRNLRSLNKADVASKLEQLISDHLLNSPNSILQSRDFIQAFGVYSIYKYQNVYKIYRNQVSVSYTFSAKTALAWCIADKYNIKSLKQKISDLDRSTAYKQTEIQFLKNAIRSSIEQDRKYIIEDKLQTTQMRLRQDKNQLNKCLNSAKYYQLKGFENETSRLGIKSSCAKHREGI